ncbi:MAG: Type 1 glutamine amidotransferase-like domain-containing protein [bacterium]|nr:Type 1 glutamine amidotransferase-like domain-containing protein [bacterium]
MSGQQLFLTSNASTVIPSIVKNLDLSKGNKLSFILTASEGEKGDKTWLEDDRNALKKAGFTVTDYTITGKNEDTLKRNLSTFDYIFLSGGNTFYLLQRSYESGFIPVIQDLIKSQGKVYIGSSAGSVIAGPKLPTYLSQLDNPKDTGMAGEVAYNFVNFTILPHWGSKNFKDAYLKGRLELAYKKDQVPLILLTDSQYVHVMGDSFKIKETKEKRSSTFL